MILEGWLLNLSFCIFAILNYCDHLTLTNFHHLSLVIFRVITYFPISKNYAHTTLDRSRLPVCTRAEASCVLGLNRIHRGENQRNVSTPAQ